MTYALLPDTVQFYNDGGEPPKTLLLQEAERAYLKAIELEPGYALAYYNLAVLYDLYVQQPELALQNYQQYLALGADDSQAEVERWIADLRRRVSTMPTTARAEGAT